MRTIFALAAGVLRLELRDRSNVFWMLIMPLGFIGLFGGMMRGDAPARPGLAIEDRDGRFLSRRLTEHLAREDLAMVDDSAAIAEGLVRTLIIPAGFEDSIAAGHRVGIALRHGKRSDVARDFSAEVRIYKAIARMLATLAEMDTVRGAHVLPVSSPGFQERYEAMAARPDPVRVDVRTAGRGRAVPSGFAGSAQSMLVLFLLMSTSMSGAVSLTQEKQSRVLSRLATLPVSARGLLAGKVLGLLGIALVQSAIILGLGSLLYHISWGHEPVALFVLLVCLGLASAALGIFLGGLLRTPDQAGAVAWLIPLLLGAIGGTWWPLELVPTWLQVAGHLSPTAWAMDGLHGLISFGRGASAVVIPCAVLLGYAAFLIAAGSRLLRVSE